MTRRSSALRRALAPVALGFLAASAAAQSTLLEYNASSGVAPDDLDVSPWQGSGLGMINIGGQFLLQDNTANPVNESGEYYSPTAAGGGLPSGTFLRNGNAYGIEFKIRPLGDVAFLGFAWPELYLTWSDDTFNYNVTIDQFSGASTSGTGDVVYGRGSFSPAISGIDWTTSHTVFIGHRQGGGAFDFYLDGVLRSTVAEGSIARALAGFEFLTDRVGFGDGTTGGPGSDDVAAEWYYIKVTDSAVPTVPPSAWAVAGGGNWSSASNWTNGVPNSVSGVPTASFGSAITAPQTVTLDAPQTIGHVIFDNANSYTIAGTATLTFSAPGSCTVTVLQGSHAITAPVRNTSPLSVAVPDGSTLSLTGPSVTSGPGATVTKNGAGTLVLTHLRGHRLQVNAGVARIAPGVSAASAVGASKVTDLVIDGGATPVATLDLTNNALVVDYTAGASPLPLLLQQVIAGRAGGTWTGLGITSSTAAATGGTGVGYAEASDLGVSTFAGQTVDADSLILAYALLGDANLDGTVGIGDFAVLAANFNLPGGWSRGDANYDGTVGIGDFSQLAANFNLSASAGPGQRGAAVPEPSIVGCTVAVAALRLGRRRRQPGA